MSLAETVEAEKRIAANATAKVLTIDIERAPGEAYFYDARTDYIPARNVKASPRTVCFAARWYGQTRPIFKAEWVDRDAMIAESWKLYDEADIVYTYNGRKFDDKHLQADWLLAGLPPPRPWKNVDLLAVVRARFGFEHKSLDAVTRRLGRPGKIHAFDLQMILDACAGNKEAQKSMRTYNVGDVELTEWLADRLRPWLWNHPHLGVVGAEKQCASCGSPDLKTEPTQNLAVLIYRTLYRCQNCGAPAVGAWHSRAASTKGVR